MSRPEVWLKPELEVAKAEMFPPSLPRASLALPSVERTGNNQSKAAKLLNLSRDRLRYRLQKHGLL